MPVGLLRIREFHAELGKAESALLKARHAYADHMALCLVCSRRVIEPDAIASIHEKLRNEAESRI
jgi:hypothetical protein